IEMRDVQIVSGGLTNYTERITKTLPTLKDLQLESGREGWSLSALLAGENQLRVEAESKNINTIKELIKVRREIGDRFSFPLMCFAVSIVAAPFGARAQRSGRSYTFASGVAI